MGPVLLLWGGAVVGLLLLISTEGRELDPVAKLLHGPLQLWDADPDTDGGPRE